ncbi:MAG: GIY-YIG nuclease family protein [Bacteroidales bacterium]|nr:GIY-YIG nuclease family protein [Bacteroidales bacterium]
MTYKSKMKGSVYILTNHNNSVLYTGVTSNLKERVIQHKLKMHSGSFSARYNISKLVYYEGFEAISEAIKREKQIKGGSRKKKIDLICKMNPDWMDLSSTLNT